MTNINGDNEFMDNEFLEFQEPEKEPVIEEIPEPPKIFTLTLADGTTLENLGLNGNNFVSQTKVDESIFKDNLATLTVFDGETETVYHNAELVQQQEWPDGTWYLVFRERTPQEIAMAALLGTATQPSTEERLSAMESALLTMMLQEE